MNILDSITGKSFSGTRSTSVPLRLSISTDIDIFITDLTKAKKDDPGNNDKAAEESPKFKIKKPDKYYEDRKKLEL